MAEREAMQSHVASLRAIAQEEFVEGVLSLIGELVLFADVGAKALGDISLAEAYAGLERVAAAFVAQRLGRPSSVEQRDVLIAAVRALDPAAADDQPYGEWDAAKWAVFNAAVRFAKETP